MWATRCDGQILGAIRQFDLPGSSNHATKTESRLGSDLSDEALTETGSWS
jgi:hypothetical protein